MLELPVSRRTDLVVQRYPAPEAGWAPGWQTMRCPCDDLHCTLIHGVSMAWRGRGVAIYLYPRPGYRR